MNSEHAVEAAASTADSCSLRESELQLHLNKPMQLVQAILAHTFLPTTGDVLEEMECFRSVRRHALSKKAGRTAH